MNTKSPDTSLADVINLLSELVVFNQYDFQQFLQKFIKIVLQVIPVDSCLIYFYDREKKQAILIGSKKLHDQQIGNIIMKEGEGITGWVAEHQKTVVIEKEAYKDPRFKYFQELPEDKFEVFLSIPILDDQGTVGVINIQNKLPYTFRKEQLQTIASLVKIISSAFKKIVLERKVNNLENQLQERKLIEKAKGILMKAKQINEEEAFHFLRKEAMNKRKSMKEIAEAVLLVLQ